jgi:TonB family protein
MAIGIGETGDVEVVKIVQHLSPYMDEAAASAVKQWKFAPAEKDGRPVAAQVKVEVNYRLPVKRAR